MPTNAINDTGVKYLYDKLHGEIEPVAEAVSDSEVTIEGNPLSFNTLSSQNAKSTILSVEPIQDLHGYPNPWVGGAGKNLIPMTVSRLKSINSIGTWNGNTYTVNGIDYTILVDSDDNVIGINANKTATANADFYLFNSYGSTNIVMPSSSAYILSVDDTNFKLFVGYGTSWSTNTNSSTDVSSQDIAWGFIRIANGTAVSNKVVHPMIRKSTESDATFAPYTNISSISGRTEIGILGCGVNIWDEEWESGAIYAQSGTDAPSDTKIRSKNYIPLVWGNTYYMRHLSTEADLFFYDENKAYLGYADGHISRNSSGTFTIPNGACYARFSILQTDYTNKISINYPSTDTSYHAYTKSNDLTINLGQTVYGGQLNVENGVLVVDKGIQDLGDFIWEYNSQYDVFISQSLVNHKVGESNLISSNYETSEPASVANMRNYTVKGNPKYPTTFYTKDPRYNDAAAFKTAVSGVQLVYELAEPLTINLTPHTINLLKGVNNISTDGDKITLTYRDGSVATLGDLTSAVDNLDSKIDESKILTDTVTGDKYILVVSNGVLSVEQISN